jgi:signal transduction histidine kinase
MMNLATNARDAMPGGGTLTIETKMIEMTNLAAENGESASRCALISFSDTGAGIDEKTKEHIFEPFYTTKEAGKATGLGLAVVYGIIRQHNGSINVTSDVGKGSKFSIFLPVLHTGAAEGHVRVPLPMARGNNSYS